MYTDDVEVQIADILESFKRHAGAEVAELLDKLAQRDAEIMALRRKLGEQTKAEPAKLEAVKATKP